MKYVGIYWTLFAPLMKKSIAKRFDRDLAQQALHRGKAEYRRLLSSADDLGPGNQLRTTADHHPSKPWITIIARK